ncbi:hypothetical protein FB451DRAFT_490457 [Mycena latifolia]|nr:hypothetical protein FB451DRAFT_490457 [Mycena latifolia]
MQPAFPPELERQIFEVSALSRRVSIPKLMLVAWRVKEWLEPLLYRTVALTNSRGYLMGMDVAEYPRFTSQILLGAIQTKPPTFFHDCVRNVFFLHESEDNLQAILSVCTGVENLWIMADYDNLLPVFASLWLKHLYTSLPPFFDAFPTSHSFFSQITHLELFDSMADIDMGSWSRLSLIPQLTHLAFTDGALIPTCSSLLETCSCLSVLVYLESWDEISYGSYAVALQKDVRFVAMRSDYFLGDWLTGVYSGLDYWSQAESFIAKRRSGEIDASQFSVFANESEDML